MIEGDLRRPPFGYPAGIVFQARLQPREAVAPSGYLQRTLFPREADIDTRENEGRTAFDIAASAGSDSVMDILLQAGAAP